MANLTVLLNRAFSAYNSGKFVEAEQLCQKIIGKKRNFFDAIHLLAVVQSGLGKKDEALASYDRALTLQPDHVEALSNRGNAFHELKRFEEALASYDRALTLRPDHAEALSNRGGTLHELKRFDEALASCDRALIVRPLYAKALYNRGNTLHELKRFEEALLSYQRALSMRPDYADAHYNEALCRLLVGDFEGGWNKYEWRWQSKQMAKRNFTKSLWLGHQNIVGKTILLHAEQGFGDAIQFSRYVPLVAGRGANVILEVPEPLQELMGSLTGAAQIIPRGAPVPDFDFHCPLLSLPLAFETRLATIPSAVPYLRAPLQALDDWATRLGPRERPRIGLAWSGHPAHKYDHNRSIGLSSLLSLLEVDATFVSLQKDLRPDDAMVLKDQSDVRHFGETLRSFSDTAALISHLDLVISVDTSVAHLAGALGKPVWVLLPYIPDWRWLLDRDDNPWYPTARLFRQDPMRAWDKVIAHVHAALHNFVHDLS